MTDEHVDYRVATFLIVDDDKVSVKMIRRAIAGLKYANPVVDVGDGLEALDHLRGAVEGNAGTLPPYIVLLDLNMPRMGGLEFLETVRGDRTLASLVVFVVTTSDAPRDITAAYEKNVAGYLVKDHPLESLRAGLDMIGAYSRLVVLP